MFGIWGALRALGVYFFFWGGGRGGEGGRGSRHSGYYWYFGGFLEL